MKLDATYFDSTITIAEIPQSPIPTKSTLNHYPYAPIDAGVVIGASMVILSMFVWQLRSGWLHQLRLAQMDQEADSKIIERLLNENIDTKKLLIEATLKSKFESDQANE